MLNYAAIVKLHDQVSGPAKQAGAAAQRMAGQIQSAQQKVGMMQRMQNGATALGHKLQAVAAVATKVSAVTGIGMGATVASATNISAKYEDLGAVFETLEGSSEKAQTSLAWVKKFTKETPYGLEATATAFSRLRAYGIDPMDGTLTTLGDTAAAMGKDVMASVEMMADAVVGENERLKEFGVRASTKGDQITYSYKNKAGEQKTSTVNKNDQDEIRRTLSSIFNEKYAGAMEKRSKTFNGILSNMTDTVAGLQSQFMSKGLFDQMKGSLQSKLDFLTRLSESGAVERWGAAAARATASVGDAMTRISSAIAAANQRLSTFVGGWGNLGRALGIIKNSASNVTDLMKGGMPAWLKPSGGDTNAQISPVLEQLRLIEKDDTLWNIAKQTSGIGSKYTEIAALNRDIIKDANKIFPGQQIRVPKLSNLPDWAKARSAAGEMSPVQQSAPAAAPAVQNIVAIAELAKTNKVIAAAVLLRATWGKTLEFIKAKFAEFSAAVGVAFNRVMDYVIANADTIKSVLSGVGTVALAAFTRWPALAGKSVQWLSGVWRIAFDGMKSRLPALQAQAQTVMGTVSNWFSTNSQKIQTALAGVATKAMEKFGAAMEWLSAKSKDGSMTQWLDDMLAKLQPTIDKIMQFGAGLWAGALAVAAAVVYVKDLVGGWENFGRLVAGLAALTALGPVIGALGVTAILMLTLGQIVWATVAAFAVFGSWIAGTAMFASIAAKIGAVIAVVKGGIMALTAVMMANPIIAIIVVIVAAIALAAYAIYANWGRIVNWWNNSTLKAQVMPVITTAIDWAKQKWAQLSNWWQTTTLAQKAMGIATASLDLARSIATALFNWWASTEFGQKTLQIATDAIDWARDKAQGFMDWWNGLSLKSISASITTTANRMFGGGDEGTDGSRALGGPVRNGGIYEVAERGPEIFRTGNRAYLMAAKGGNVIPMAQYRNQRDERTAQRIPSAQASMGKVVTEMRGMHELTVNLRTAPGTEARVEQKRTSGNASKFNLGKQAGAL